MGTMLEEALSYVRRGWYVFPCREKPGESFIRNGEVITPAEKTPYVSKGLNDASIDEDQIRAWWEMWPDAMIGINAGKSGLFVIDIDKKHINGLDTYSQWGINDSAGLHSITPSGGMHIVFSGIGKSSVNGKTGIDTRGEGGYFIAPPSKIIEGEYTGEYRFFNDWGREPGVIPDGLMEKLFPESTTKYVRGTAPVDGSRKALSRATTTFMVEGAIQGERNNKLFRAAADFAGCGYNYDEAKVFLTPICEKIGLSRGELDTVLTHAFAKPRTPAIPDTIQEKIMSEGKNVASKITHEEEAVMEFAVLASMIIDRQCIPVIQDILGFDDFNYFKNKIIYKAINRMYSTGMKIDNLTLANELEKETIKVSLDGITRLTDNYFINPENAITYAGIIKEKSSMRKLEALLDNKEKYLKENLTDSVSTLEKDVAEVALYGGIKTSAILTAEQAARMVNEQTEKLASGEIEQLKIGFSEYDKQVGGLYTNELIVCAARSGDGKSAMALSILNYVSLIQKKPTALFSLEMSTHESVCRLICQLTGIPFKNIYRGSMNPAEWKDYYEAKDRIAGSKMYFDDGFGMTVPEIRSKIRKLVDKKVELIVIDQLEQIKGYEGMPMYMQFDRIAYDIKDMTLEFNIPIILNHQLNRNIMDRKLKNPEPILSDLNQAGEKPANQVWVILHNKDQQTGKILNSKVKVLKNRNGPTLEFAVIYVGNRMLFSEPTKEEERIVFHGGDDGHDVIPFWDTDKEDK